MLEYTDYFEFRKTLDQNAIAYNKYLPKSEVFFFIRKNNVAYYKIESIEEIEERILNLDLPKNYDDLNEKFVSIIKLWLLLTKYADLLLKHNYISRSSRLNEKFDCYVDKEFDMCNYKLTDLNHIQRMIYNLTEIFKDEIEEIHGNIYYKGYIEELDEFCDIIKADIKLCKFYRQQIDEHKAERIRIKKEIERLLAE